MPRMNPDGIRLVVGLGNPGPIYAGTRHNVGFMVLDRYVASGGGRFRRDGDAEVAQMAGVYFLKPMTYMNRSGQAVAPFCRRYGIRPEELLVVVDDLDLPPGQIRIRRGGSSGGHNGLKSVMAALNGATEFARLRVGIGRPPLPADPVNWVLGRWPRSERAFWEERLGWAVSALATVLEEGLEVAMNRYNGR
jgi:PTH1 family peptidyl-tRNA hydrolase